MATWPPGLPQEPLYEGFSEQPPNLLLRTQMDVGPAKVRRRFRAGVRPIALRFGLTSTQIEDLDVFYMTTLQGGSLTYDWTHPRTGSAIVCRFVTQPKYEPLAKEYWIATMSVEIMP